MTVILSSALSLAGGGRNTVIHPSPPKFSYNSRVEQATSNPDFVLPVKNLQKVSCTSKA